MPKLSPRKRARREALLQNNAQDPHAEREARRYEKPIASREHLLDIMTHAQGPVDFATIQAQLDYTDEESRVALQRRFNAMLRDGQIMQNRKGEFAVVAQTDLIAGRVLAHKDGFGFVQPDAGGEDLFLTPRQMRTLMHGDHVLVREKLSDRSGKREGKLVEVLERSVKEVSGHYYREGGLGFVVPQNIRLNQEVIVQPGAEQGARHGDIVVARISEYPTAHNHAQGQVIEVLGRHLSPVMQVELAIRNFGLPHGWSEDIEQALAQISVRLPEDEVARRKDIRHLPLVTIDGEDARDFDDAVYAQQTDNGWLLFVAIADVSWYVAADTALDEEAAQRGTSVYFPNRVLPMLPELLSNGLCSINPDEDRLCLLCEMEISKKGRMAHYRFHEAVMRSHARLTYTQVAAMLAKGDKPLCQRYEALLPHLQSLQGLYDVLARARLRRGAIDFETPEIRFIFDASGEQVDGFEPVTRNIAHKLIEECMITANVAAARFLEEHEVLGLFRVHKGPEESDLQNLRDFLAQCGLSLGGKGQPTSGDYSDLIRAVRDKPAFHVIQTVLLRSLKQAMYQSANEGHFGLALKQYAHFTSPIRRYPDLLVHRAIRYILQGNKPCDYRYCEKDMEKLGHSCSANERRANEAGRDIETALKCKYLQQHIGDEFSGHISGVNSFGVFVELPGLSVSGLVHVSALGHDYFHHDPVHHRLVGNHTRVIFKLGDGMQVRIVRADVQERKVDLEPVSLPGKLMISSSGKSARRRPAKGRFKGRSRSR